MPCSQRQSYKILLFIALLLLLFIIISIINIVVVVVITTTTIIITICPLPDPPTSPLSLMNKFIINIVIVATITN